jgi:hypothetical protein
LKPWVIDDTSFPKTRRHSAGASSLLGAVAQASCQVAVTPRAIRFETKPQIAPEQICAARCWFPLACAGDTRYGDGRTSVLMENWFSALSYSELRCTI